MEEVTVTFGNCTHLNVEGMTATELFELAGQENINALRELIRRGLIGRKAKQEVE